MHELVRRDAAVRATRIRFAGRPFKWGGIDCVKMAAWHVRHMGHKVVGLTKAGSYRSARSARAALERAGFDTLAAAITAQGGLVEIPPAMALPGDLMLTPGTDDWEALVIVLSNGDVFGFREGEMIRGPQVMRLTITPETRAWRV